MDKIFIVEKLEMLVSLIEKTEPTLVPSDTSNGKNLFSTQFITTMEMLKKVRDWHAGRNVQDPDSEREELISMMKCANRIWKTRKKILNGEWDSLEMLEVHDTIEDYIAQGQKINAIKYYRQEMTDKFDEQVTLREAKDHIDHIANSMKLRGITR